MASQQDLLRTLSNLKERILEVENSGTKLSEQDTRQGLINPLFRSLGWDFSDFNSVKSELRHPKYNNPVDYAFFNKKDKDKPVLLVEAKALRTKLSDGNIVKQLCSYLGEMGVQWGLITDGNKYIMYNSTAGISYEEQRFLTMQIKTMNTEDGLSEAVLADKLMKLLSRECLESDDLQKLYESYVIDRHIEDAFNSLLSEPFDTLAQAIRREFKQDRVKINPGIKIPTKSVVSYLESLKDGEGKISLDIESDSSKQEDSMLKKISLLQKGDHSIVKIPPKITKRITISNLLAEKIVEEGDSWRFENKGEFIWGRITGNGELEVNGKTYTSPSQAGQSITNKSCAGWDRWLYKEGGEWHKIRLLRDKYRQKHNNIDQIRRDVSD